MSASRRPKFAVITTTVDAVGRTLLALYDQRIGWMLPFVLVLLVVAGIISLLALAGPITPFLYPLF